MEENENTENKLVEEMLEELIRELIVESANLEVGSTEHTVVIDDIVHLYGELISGVKVGMEYDDRTKQREFEIKKAEMEIEARRKDSELEFLRKKEEIVVQNKSRRKELVLQAIGETAKAALPIVALVAITALGWKNENDPIHPQIITSSTTRQTAGILSKGVKF